MKNIKFIAALVVAATVGMTTSAFAGDDYNSDTFADGNAEATLSGSTISRRAYATTESDAFANELSARIYDRYSQNSDKTTKKSTHKAQAKIRVQDNGFDISSYHQATIPGSGYDSTSLTISD